MILRQITEILAQDRIYKPTDFDLDSIKLSEIYNGQARDTLRTYLLTRGMGDRGAVDPVQTGLVGRLVRMLSGLYAFPATRMLYRGGEILPADDADTKAFSEVANSMDLDIVWGEIEALTTLLMQVVVTFGESEEDGTIVARVFEPHNVIRWPSPGAADKLEKDVAFALCLVDHAKPEHCRYQLWQQEDDGWHFWVVDKASNIIEAPYGPDGLIPFAELPALLVTARPALGKAWIPIPQNRLTLAQAIDALANEILLLVKQQAHSRQIFAINRKGQLDDVEVGPDTLLEIDPDDEFKIHELRPMLEEANKTWDRFQTVLALSEDLPADVFSASSSSASGAAQKVRERDIEKRRQVRARLASKAEAKAYRKIAAMLAVPTVAARLGLPQIPEDVRLIATFARPRQEVDEKEMQEISFKEMAIGTKSKIEHIADMRRIPHDEAIALHDRIEDERRRYPLEPTRELVAEAVSTESQNVTQNPGALVSGPKPALGPASGKKTPGAFNPELGTSTEGASVTDAVRRAG